MTYRMTTLFAFRFWHTKKKKSSSLGNAFSQNKKYRIAAERHLELLLLAISSRSRAGFDRKKQKMSWIDFCRVRVIIEILILMVHVWLGLVNFIAVVLRWTLHLRFSVVELLNVIFSLKRNHLYHYTSITLCRGRRRYSCLWLFGSR